MEILLDCRVWNSILEVSKSGKYQGFSIEVYSTGGGTIQSTNGAVLLSLPFPGVTDGVVGRWSFLIPPKSKATKNDLVKIKFDPVLDDSKAKICVGFAEYNTVKFYFPDTKAIEDKKGVDTGCKTKFSFSIKQSALLWKVFENLDFGDFRKIQHPTIQYDIGWEHGFVNFNYGGHALVMGVY